MRPGSVATRRTGTRNDPRTTERKRDGRGKGPTDKQPVVSLVHYETRTAHARVVADVTGKSLLPAIEEMMEAKRTHLHTDGARGLPAHRPLVRPARMRWITRAGSTRGATCLTNLNEGFHSQLKRSLDGTHHHVSVEHLQRYLNQFSWLYTHCKATDSQRMRTLLGNVEGRRLTYKPMVAKVDF